MSDSFIIFLCDDQIKEPEGSWIGDFKTAIGPNAGHDGQRYVCEHIPTRDQHELDGGLHREHFLGEIRKLAGTQDFGVVSDARFGEQPDGGGALLAQLGRDDKLKTQFKRGLVYSVEPYLGEAKTEPKAAELARPTTEGSVAYQAPVIMHYLQTGELRQLQELQDLCLRLYAALDAWLKTRDVLFIPTEWNLGGGRVSLFDRETAWLFVDLDRYLDSYEPRYKLFGAQDDLLHNVLCPYQSLRCAADLRPDHATDGDRHGGWIRLVFELRNQAGFSDRVAGLMKGSTQYQRKWIRHHADRLERTLKTCAEEPSVVIGNLRAGVAFEHNVIDSFLKKLPKAH